MRFFIFIFLILLLFVTGPGINQAAGAEQLNDLSPIMEKAREDGEKMTLPVNQYSEEGLKAAQRSADTFCAPAFQELIQDEQKRLEQEVFGDYIAPWEKKKFAGNQSKHASSLADTEKIYLFFSSSVPDETVRSYIAAIAATNDPNVIPVMRGFVGGMEDIQASTKYFSRILKEDPDCQDISSQPCKRYQVSIKLNPLLFAKYKITRVPAVVYENEEDVFLIQGDAGLAYLLERINREVAKKSLDNLIQQMRSTGH